MSKARLALNIFEEILQTKPWKQGDADDGFFMRRENKCDATNDDRYTDVKLYGDEEISINALNSYDRAGPLIRNLNAQIIPKADALEKESDDRINKMYDKVDEEVLRLKEKIDEKFARLYDEVNEQYTDYLDKLEQEYKKGYDEEKDKLFNIENTKIEKEKAKKKEFDDAVLKNIENRKGFKEGCNNSTQSEARMKHEAYEEERKKREEKEIAEAKGEEPKKEEEPKKAEGEEPKKAEHTTQAEGAFGNAEVEGWGKKEKRSEVVKKIMKKKGLSMIEASKYVKSHNLY